MKIYFDKKRSSSKSSLLSKVLLIFFTFVLFFLFYLLQSVNVHVWFQMHGFVPLESDYKSKAAQLISDVAKIPSSWLSLYFSNSDSTNNNTQIPTIRFDIKYNNMEKLKNKIKESKSTGILTTEEDDYVPIFISSVKKTVKAKIRLKGDWLDHIKGSKWSFRVHIKGDETLFGMRKFSIQNPSTRGYSAPMLFLKTMRMIQSDIIIPRYRLVRAIVNGNDIGIMLIVEHFSKELLEASGRSESIILKLDESDKWSLEAGISNPVYHNFKNNKIVAFQDKKISTSKKLHQDFQVGIGLFRGFVNGELKPSEIFDAKLIGSYLATLDLFAYVHGLAWFNMRFYYNPVTAKLEPIVFDTYNPHYFGKLPSQRTYPFGEVMAILLLKDEKIKYYYREAALKYLSLIRSNQLQNTLMQLDKQIRKVLFSEFFLLQPFNVSYLESQIKCLFDVTLCEAGHRQISKKRLQEFIEKSKRANLLRAYLISNNTGDLFKGAA